MQTKQVVPALIAVVLATVPAHASVVWDGDVSKGTGVFKSITGDGNCGTGSVQPFSDSQRGTVWRYNKPSSSGRCENHGVRNGSTNVVFGNGSTYWLGWFSKLSTSANNNANFQWKSFGDGHQQNYPIVIKMISNNVHLMQRQPGASLNTIWSRSLSANTWNHFALGIFLSTGTTGGWIEFYYNGVRQTFTNGSQRFMCRTFDTGNHNCPKWGIYGGTGTTMNNYTDSMLIGTTYADVDMGGGTSPTPTPTPTPQGPTPTPPPGGGFSGYYRIMGVQSGRALVVQSASTANSANVIVWDYNDNTSDNDEWEIRSIGSGYHRIIARHSGKDMTVASASTAAGANIFQYTYGGSATNDEWQIVDSGAGQYEIRNRNSGRNVQAMGTANGAAVQQHSDDDGTDQRFQLISIP